MTKLEKQLLAILDSIEGNGTFVVSGVKDFVHPGLNVKGGGEITFPVSPTIAKKMKKLARQAPFGKGSQTIVDTSVRRTWEIDAGQLSFKNKAWFRFIDRVLKDVKKGLGLDGCEIEASLYKLLIYEKGDFFVRHKDSEKEKDMFGTLVVNLPSAHTGGELIVSFDGEEERIHFAEANPYQIPFAGFFADCDHEVKPITSGYRMVLTYNLVQSSSANKVFSSAIISTQVGKLAKLLASWASSFTDQPKVILLEHHYTPANFSKDALKGSDLPRVKALLQAAEQAGYFAKLALVTHYQSGELEDDFYYERYDCDNHGDGDMGEIYEETTSIKDWVDDEMPDLGHINLDSEHLLADFEIGEGEPSEEDQEGYTGNTGMTIDYWYYYGAVVLWPKSKHKAILNNLSVADRLVWLKFYVEHWDDGRWDSPQYVRELIAHMNWDKERDYDGIDYSIVAEALAVMKDKSFLLKKAVAFLEAKFDAVDASSWLRLLEVYKPEDLSPIFAKAMAKKNVYRVNHFLEILKVAREIKSTPIKSFVLAQMQKYPEYLHRVSLSRLNDDWRYHRKATRKEVIRNIIENTFILSAFWETNGGRTKKKLIDKIFEQLTKSLTRGYVNTILVPLILSEKYADLILVQKLKVVAIEDLEKRTKKKPAPLPNWKRKVPNSKRYAAVWDILRPFLESPTQQVFDYKKNKSYREEMEGAIRQVTIDLKLQTISRSSPYTLRLTKTNAAFERALKKWKEDMKWFNALSK